MGLRYTGPATSRLDNTRAPPSQVNVDALLVRGAAAALQLGPLSAAAPGAAGGPAANEPGAGAALGGAAPGGETDPELLDLSSIL